MPSKLIEATRVEPGSAPKLSGRDPGDDLGFAENKEAGRIRAADATARITRLQEVLWAEGRQSLLVVLQGMDSSGKDGVTRRLLSGVNPQGCEVTSFKAPTSTELAHDFLWRVHARTPARGVIGVFNRSHYEDVVTCEVLGDISRAEANRRCSLINAWESLLVEQGTTILKIFLHISKEEQRERLQARVDTPEKHWKMNLADLETRERWDDYQKLYERTIKKTSTEHAPWYVVPGDRRWVRDVVVGELMLERLRWMRPKFPPAKTELQGLIVQ